MRVPVAWRWASSHHRLWHLTGLCTGAELIGQTTMRTVTDYSFGVIPNVPVDGRLRVGLRHQPLAVPRRQHLCRPLEGGLGIATIAAAAASPRFPARRWRPPRRSRGAYPECAASAIRNPSPPA